MIFERSQALRALDADSTARLRERAAFDPANLGHRLVAASEPLSATERLEHMAIGETLLPDG